MCQHHMRAAVGSINALTKFLAFVKMSMSRDRRYGLPNHNDYSPMQGGVMVACAFTFIASGSYAGAGVSLIVTGLLWVLSENKTARRYYAEFLKLPSKVQKRWSVCSWMATVVLWVYIFAMIFCR